MHDACGDAVPKLVWANYGVDELHVRTRTSKICASPGRYTIVPHARCKAAIHRRQHRFESGRCVLACYAPADNRHPHSPLHALRLRGSRVVSYSGFASSRTWEFPREKCRMCPGVVGCYTLRTVVSASLAPICRGVLPDQRMQSARIRESARFNTWMWLACCYAG